MLAAELLTYDDATLAAAIDNGTLTEFICNDETIPQPDHGLHP